MLTFFARFCVPCDDVKEFSEGLKAFARRDALTQSASHNSSRSSCRGDSAAAAAVLRPSTPAGSSCRGDSAAEVLRPPTPAGSSASGRFRFAMVVYFFLRMSRE